MKFNFNLLLVVFALVYVGVNSAKLHKNNEKSSVDSISFNTEKKRSEEELSDKSLIVDKLSETLNFLSSILQLIGNQLNFEDIANSGLIQSNNLLSSLISNPAIHSILSPVFKTLRVLIAQASKLIDQIQALLPNTDFNGPVNYRIGDLVIQLKDTLNQILDLLKSNIALSVPGLDSILDAIIAPIISLLDSLDTSINGVGVLPRTFGSQLNGICSALQNIPADTESGIGALLPSLDLGSIFDTILGILRSILEPILGTGGLETSPNTNINGARFAIPLKTEKLSNFEQSSYGLINGNKLVITSVMTTNITDRDSKSLDSDLVKERSFFHQMSLHSLQSMMSSLIKDMRGGNNKHYLNSLQCQIDGLGCSLREKDNQQSLNNCVNKLSTCVGKETLENSKKY